MRADELAVELDKESGAEDLIHVIEFIMAKEKYGIEADYVMEVCSSRNLKKIPCTPPHIAGVINFHGQILPVVDLNAVLGLPIDEFDSQPIVIVLHSEHQMKFAILADILIGDNSILASSMQTSLSTLSDVQEDYFKGITDDNTVILNGFKIMTDPKLIVNDKF